MYNLYKKFIKILFSKLIAHFLITKVSRPLFRGWEFLVYALNLFRVLSLEYIPPIACLSEWLCHPR